MISKEQLTRAGHPRLRPDEKREAVSVSMSPEMYKLIVNSAKIGSFSMKLEYCMREYFILKHQLVQYQDDEQRENGTPAILNTYAVRIFACSSFLNGFTFRETAYAEKIDRILESIGGVGKKSPQWIEKKLIPALRNAGFVVQVIDEIERNLFDVWILYPMTGEGLINCNQCKVITSLQDFIDKIKLQK
jgi:hypothetical protein